MTRFVVRESHPGPTESTISEGGQGCTGARAPRLLMTQTSWTVLNQKQVIKFDYGFGGGSLSYRARTPVARIRSQLDRWGNATIAWDRHHRLELGSPKKRLSRVGLPLINLSETLQQHYHGM